MDDTTNVPPKGNGNLAYVGMAIFMLLLTGVLLWMKSTKREASAAPPQASVTRPVKTIRNAPPPPPPPPEMEEVEGAAPDAATGRAILQARKDACAGPCRGEVTSALQSQLAQRGQQSRGCYERALRNNSRLTGTVMVALRLDATGKVCSVSLASDTVRDVSVSECVVRRFETMVYSRPKGGCLDVQVPIRFVPNG